MNFKDAIIKYESNTKDNYIKRNGYIPVIFTAVHTINQRLENGTLKLAEPFTKAITTYVSEKTNSYCFIKNVDTGIDSNSLNEDEFKKELLNIITKNNIKLLIDIHGAKETREFDVELGTLNNLSADYSSQKELKEAFEEHGIINIAINEPFKGGGITQYIYQNTDIDIIQIEINRKYREITKIENLEKVCNSLISFANQFSKYHKKSE